MVYVLAGTLNVGTPPRRVCEGELGLLAAGDAVSLTAHRRGGECLFLAGQPLGESVARMGPFVMNTRQEVEQAVADYHAGRMGTIGD